MRRVIDDTVMQALARREYVAEYFAPDCFSWQEDVLRYYGENLLVRAPRCSGKSTLLQWFAVVHADLFQQRVLVIVPTAQLVRNWYDHLCPTEWQERRRIVIRMERQGRGGFALIQVGSAGEIFLASNFSQFRGRTHPDLLLVDEAAFCEPGTICAALRCFATRRKILISGYGGRPDGAFNRVWEDEAAPFDRLRVTGGPHWEQEQEDEQRRQEEQGRVSLVMRPTLPHISFTGNNWPRADLPLNMKQPPV